MEPSVGVLERVDISLARPGARVTEGSRGSGSSGGSGTIIAFCKVAKSPDFGSADKELRDLIDLEV